MSLSFLRADSQRGTAELTIPRRKRGQVVYKPHLFASVLAKKLQVWLIHKTIDLRESKLPCCCHKLN